jgi:hypothetical protein
VIIGGEDYDDIGTHAYPFPLCACLAVWNWCAQVGHPPQHCVPRCDQTHTAPLVESRCRLTPAATRLLAVRWMTGDLNPPYTCAPPGRRA